MTFAAIRSLAGVFCISALACICAHASCPVDTVIVKGRVEDVPRNASVRVQLVYEKSRSGESGEVTVQDGTFSIPVEFLTQSRRPVIDGLLEKCNRKPESVVVTLITADRSKEYDRVSLSFAADFKMADASAYALRSEAVLHGPR